MMAPSVSSGNLDECETARLRAEVASLQEELKRERAVREQAKQLSEVRVAAFRQACTRTQQEEATKVHVPTPSDPLQRVEDPEKEASERPVQQKSFASPTASTNASDAGHSPTASSAAAEEEIAQRRESFQRGNHHQTNCTLCNAYYTMLKREHHCRSCFLSVCSDCSGVKGSGSQRYCDMCVMSNSLASSVWTKLSAVNKEVWIERLRGAIATMTGNERGSPNAG